MKYSLFALLLLTGCADTQYIPLPQAPGPRAAGSISQMEWVCEETDVNDALVWVRCKFHNEAPPLKDVCIQVTFNDNKTRQEVAAGRKVCSGPLWAGGTFDNYTVFFKEKRIALAQSCGPKLENCYMSTKWVKND